MDLSSGGPDWMRERSLLYVGHVAAAASSLDMEMTVGCCLMGATWDRSCQGLSSRAARADMMEPTKYCSMSADNVSSSGAGWIQSAAKAAVGPDTQEGGAQLF